MQDPQLCHEFRALLVCYDNFEKVARQNQGEKLLKSNSLFFKIKNWWLDRQSVHVKTRASVQFLKISCHIKPAVFTYHFV